MIHIKQVQCLNHTKESDGAIRAVLVRAPRIGIMPVWVPFTAVHDDSEVWHKGDVGTLILHEWYATKKGWM